MFKYRKAQTRFVSRLKNVSLPLDSPGNVEEDNGVHFVFFEFGRHVLAVTLQRHQVGQPLPLPPQQVLAAHLAVEHLVPQPRVELLRVCL